MKVIVIGGGGRIGFCFDYSLKNKVKFVSVSFVYESCFGYRQKEVYEKLGRNIKDLSGFYGKNCFLVTITYLHKK